METDRLAPTEHVIICTGTSHVRDDVDQRRVWVEPDQENGLRVPTQFQADKITITRRSKCGPVVGRLSSERLEQLTATVAVLIGVAD